MRQGRGDEVTYDGFVRLELILLALESLWAESYAIDERPVPFKLSKSLMEIYRTQNDHERLTYSKSLAQNEHGRHTFPALLPHRRTLPTQDPAEPGDAANVASVQG